MEIIMILVDSFVSIYFVALFRVRLMKSVYLVFEDDEDAAEEKWRKRTKTIQIQSNLLSMFKFIAYHPSHIQHYIVSAARSVIIYI